MARETLNNGAQINWYVINGGLPVIVTDLEATLGITFDPIAPVTRVGQFVMNWNISFDQEPNFIRPRGLLSNAGFSLIPTTDLALIHVRQIEADITVSFNQTLQVARIRELEPYAVTTFTSSLNLAKRKELETDGDISIDLELDALIKTQQLSTLEDVEFEQGSDLTIPPKFIWNDTIQFAGAIEIDHDFFGHWHDGLRIIVESEDRVLPVMEEIRTIEILPDPPRLTPIIMVPRERRRIMVPKDPPERVPMKERKVFA